MNAWLLLAQAALAKDPVVRDIRWEIVPARPGDGPLFLGTAPMRVVAASGPLRLDCPNDVAVERLAVSFQADGTPVALYGPFSVGQDEGRFTVFEAAPLPLRRWLVPDACQAQRLDDDVDPDGLARLEDATPTGEAFSVAMLDEDEAAWVAAGAASRERWLAVRPFGPWMAHVGRRKLGGETVHWAAFDAPPTFHKDLPAGHGWTLRGPLRLALDIVPIGDAPVACVSLDGTPHCAPVAPHEEVRVVAGQLVRERATYEGRPVGHRIAFSWLLDEGEHQLVLGGDALVAQIAGLPVDWRDGTLADPATTETFDPPPPWSLEPPPSTVSVDPVGQTDRTLLTIPSDRTAFAPTEARWLPLDAVLDSGGSWFDATGTAQLWLEPLADAPCVVSWGAAAWSARPRTALQRIRWTGPGPADPALPEVGGCTALIRVVGAQRGDLARAAARYERVAAGRSTTWAPAIGTSTYLWATLPDNHPGRLALDVDMPGRGRLHYEILPLRTERVAPVTDVYGARWTLPVRIPLPPVTGPVTVTPAAPAAFRLTRIAAPDDLERQRAPTVVPPESLLELSRRVADAPDDASRAAALRTRAAALLAADHAHLALDDLGRATEIEAAEGPDQDNARLVLWRDAIRPLAGTDAWAPVDDEWIPGAGPEIEPLVRAAAVGNLLDVARAYAHSARPADARVWWRRALLAGQTPSSDDRHRMYLDLARVPGEMDGSWTWPLRALSSWESVHAGGGERVRAVRERWPDVEDPDRQVRRQLFPDKWSDDVVLRFREGWDLALPPSAVPRSWEARCRLRRALEGAGTCTFELTDAAGQRLALFPADPWGRPTRIDVPSTSDRLYLHVTPSWAVDAEIRAMDLVTAGDLARRAWDVPAGRTLRFELLAPTVLRLETWDHASGGNDLSVRVQGGPALASGALHTRASWLLPIDAVGPVVVEVTPTRDTRIDPAFRTAAARSVEPTVDRHILASGEELVSVLGFDPDAAADPLVVPAGRPTGNPPLTVFAGVSAGTVEGDPAAAEGRLAGSVRVQEEVGLASRPGEPPIWVAARGWHEVAPPGSTFGADGGLDWRVHRYSTRWWWRGDAGIARGTLHDGNALTVANGRIGTTVEKFLWPRWDFVARLDGFVRGVVNDVPAEGVDLSGGYALWDQYDNDHPAGLAGRLEARWQPGPWVRVAPDVGLVTNAPGSPFLERWSFGVTGAYAIPSVVADAGVHVLHWEADDHRDEGRWDPVADLGLTATPWPHGVLALQFTGDLRVGLIDGDVTALAGLRLFGSSDRGLDDVRPSDLPWRAVQDWAQDRAAARTWLKEGE